MNRFETSILHTLKDFIDRKQFCDMEVMCSDGRIFVPGLVLAAVCPILSRLPEFLTCMEDICLILPDTTCDSLHLFIGHLLSANLSSKTLQDSLCMNNVLRIFSIKSLMPIYQSENNENDEPAFGADAINTTKQSSNDLKVTHIGNKDCEFKETEWEEVKLMELDLLVKDKERDISHDSQYTEKDDTDIMTEGGTTTELMTLADSSEENSENMFDEIQVDKDTSSITTIIDKPETDIEELCTVLLDNNSVLPTDSSKSVVNLSRVDIDTIGDDVLSENFCDQVGRLVCLVCYKIMPSNAYKEYRSHMKGHDGKQLEKVYVIMPETYRPEPGPKRNFVSDQQIKENYRELNGEFVCNKCPKRFKPNEKMNFKRHIQYHTLKEKNYVYRCNECNREFNNSSNLNRHFKLMHEKQSFRCLHCDFENKRKEKLEYHLLTVHKDRGCNYEDVPLTKGLDGQELGDLTEPLTSLTEESTLNTHVVFKCSGCHFRRRTEACVADHIKQNHDGCGTIQKIALEPVEPPPHLKCDLCNILMGSKNELWKHNVTVHNIKYHKDKSVQLKCQVCHVICASKSALRSHQRMHKEKKFTCQSCEKSYFNLHQLREHIQKGLCKDENRKCFICNKFFFDKHILDIHMKIHNNIREFKCEHCGKTFTQKRTLKEHYLTHNSTRNYQCNVCQKKFVQLNHLKYHMSSQHPNEAPDEAKHKCNLCSKAFPFEYLLKKHLVVHGKTNTQHQTSGLRCVQCLTWFPSPILLKEHRQQKQCQPMHSCDQIIENVEPVTQNEIHTISNSISQERGHPVHLKRLSCLPGNTEVKSKSVTILTQIESHHLSVGRMSQHMEGYE